MTLTTCGCSLSTTNRGTPTERIKSGECDGDRWCDCGLFLEQLMALSSTVHPRVAAPAAHAVHASHALQAHPLNFRPFGTLLSFRRLTSSCHILDTRVTRVAQDLGPALGRRQHSTDTTLHSDCTPFKFCSALETAADIKFKTDDAFCFESCQDLYPALGRRHHCQCTNLVRAGNSHLREFGKQTLCITTSACLEHARHGKPCVLKTSACSKSFQSETCLCISPQALV